LSACPKPLLNEFHRIAFRKAPCLDRGQGDLDEWIRGYDEARPARCGKAPTRIFLDAIPIANEKMSAA
jgi:hypothetical protein